MILPDGCSLRHATADDLPAYGAFLRRIFEATYGPAHPPERMARHLDERFSDEQLRAELADPAHTLLLMEMRGVLSGFALLHASAAPPEVVGARPVEVARFYVGTEWHGHGLATLLMASALQVARDAGHDVAWLGVWERNPRAIRYYQKEGFRIIGRNVYVFGGQAEDDHLMARSLLDP
jgi:GNAT superfamily N-acetyltransferase